MDHVFLETFSSLPRQGPGSFKSTEKAYKSCANLPDNANILDIGCGRGKQTFDLATLSKGTITAIDINEPFIEMVNQEAVRLGLSNRLIASVCDMNDIPYALQSFDLIWSEGAVYIMGFEKGLYLWKPFLKKNGYLVISDVAWFKTEIPEEVKEFWAMECPDLDVKDAASNIKSIEKAGYRLIDSFKLPEEAWWNDFYTPLQKRIQTLREKYSDDQKAIDVLEMIQHEIDMYKKYHEYYGYMFYVMQNG